MEDGPTRRPATASRASLLFLALCLLLFWDSSGVLWAAEDPAREAELRVHELRKEKRYKEALAYLDLAVKQSPESGNLRGLYSWIYLEDLKDPKSALDQALRFKRELPKHRGGYYWSARAYDALGDFANCVATLEDFRAFGRDFVRDNVKAGCLYKAGKLEEAIGSLPDEENLHDNAPKYAGWPVWLKGQIARRRVFGDLQPKLQAQALSASGRERAIALAKLALLGVPEGGEVAGLTVSPQRLSLKTEADNLKKALTAEVRFSKELEAPKPSETAKRVRLEEAFAEMWKALDLPQGREKLPPLSGKYMTAEMLEASKKYPAYASPFVIQIDERGEKYSYGAAWMAADGEVDTSFEPGRCYTIAQARDGALWHVAACLKNRFSEFSTTSWKREGKDLVMTTRSWTDLGDSFAVLDSTTRFLPVP